MEGASKDVGELQQEIRVLRQKLEKAIEQRDGFMRNYHAVMRVPHAERHEIYRDCNDDLDKISATPSR